MVDRAFDLVRRAVDGLVERLRVVRDGRRHVAADVSLDQAALVGLSVLQMVLIGEVDFNSGDALSEALQCGPHDLFDTGRQALTGVDVVVAIDLNLHLLVPAAFVPFAQRAEPSEASGKQLAGGTNTGGAVTPILGPGPES